nr:MAG TPA: hypothetical protein [Caudoviricetes sp.]
MPLLVFCWNVICDHPIVDEFRRNSVLRTASFFVVSQICGGHRIFDVFVDGLKILNGKSTEYSRINIAIDHHATNIIVHFVLALDSLRKERFVVFCFPLGNRDERMLELQNHIFSVCEFLFLVIPEFLTRNMKFQHGADLLSVRGLGARNFSDLLIEVGRQNAIDELGSLVAVQCQLHKQIGVGFGLDEFVGQFLALHEPTAISALNAVSTTDQILEDVHQSRNVLGGNDTIDHLAEAAGHAHLHIHQFSLRKIEMEGLSSFDTIVVDVGDFFFQHCKFSFQKLGEAGASLTEYSRVIGCYQPAASSRVLISLGSSRVGSVAASPPLAPSVPYSLASSFAIFSAPTLVESITREAVGLKPSTATGVVDSSQLKVIASGESLMVL